MSARAVFPYLLPCGCVALLLAGLLAGDACAQQPPAGAGDDIPVTGRAGQGLEAIDAAVLGIIRKHGIPGATLAIAVEGRLVLAKGYGYADLDDGVAMQPDTAMGLASLSKPITALAILKLVEDGKLDLDDKAFDILAQLTPPAGVRADPRLASITVRQLLTHSGGWDRSTSGDPVLWSRQIAKKLGVRLPLTADQFISYMMGAPLDFAPGTRSEYSNVGFVILGQIVEKASGESYEAYVRKAVLQPAGVRRAFLADPQKYQPGESRHFLAGSDVAIAPMNLPLIRAAGGWNASAIDMMRLMTALDGSRGTPLLKVKTFQLMLAPPVAPLRPRADGTYCGLGWESVAVSPQAFGYFQDGNYHGMRTFLKRSPRGVNTMLAFNASMHPDLSDRQMVAGAIREVRQALDRVGQYPSIDLFKE